MVSPLHKFIEQLERLQAKRDPAFPDGIFYAERVNELIGYRRKDTTLFFSTIICFTLQSIRKNVSTDLRQKIDRISENVVRNYHAFQNKDGLNTYNFWRTKPSGHFPNGFIFRHFDHFRIPDDVDDTIFVYLTTSPSPEELGWLKNKLSLHANGVTQKIRNTFPEFISLPAYSTWFGKKMYIEFDVCVLSNLMYGILHFNLPLNAHDHATLAYIRSVIEGDRYLQAPFRYAHHYPRSPLIIYHVARLVAAFNPPALEPVRAKLTSDAQTLLQNAAHDMDRVILSTSLMRLGIDTQRIAVENFTDKHFKGFFFFIAGLMTAYENPLLYRISPLSIFHMYWICEAHNWTLLAEYENLWQEQNS